MAPIVLLKNFTLAISSGQAFKTDWISIPSEHKNMDMHVHVQSVVPAGMASGFAVGLETSYDTVEEVAMGAGVTVTAPGSFTDHITSGVGPMARVHIQTAEAAAHAIVSVWLQPKSD